MKHVFCIKNPERFAPEEFTVLFPLLEASYILVWAGEKWTWWHADFSLNADTLRVPEFQPMINPKWVFAIVRCGQYLRDTAGHRIDGEFSTLNKCQILLEHEFHEVRDMVTDDRLLVQLLDNFGEFEKRFRGKENKEANLDELLNKEIAAFRKNYDSGVDPDVSSFFTINQQGRVYSSYGTICHSELFNQHGYRVHIYDEVRSYYKQSNDPLSYAEYVDYLMTKSVFKECFLPRTLDEVLDSGVLYDPNAPGMLVYASAIMLRQPAEFPKQLPSMRWFADNLTDGDWIGAWVMAQMVDVVDDGKSFNRIYWDNRHKIFSENYSVKQVAHFFKNGYKGKNKIPAATWNGDGRWNLSSKLLDHLPALDDVDPNFADLEVKEAGFGKRNQFDAESVKLIWNKFKEFGYA